MHRRLLLPALLLALTAGGACSGDPEPIIEPTPSTTPAPTPPASEPTPTAEPEAESAKEFIRRWQAEAQMMQLTGNSRGYRSLSSRCSDCDALADEIERIYASGGSIRGGDVEISEIERVGRSDGQQIFEFERLADPMEILSADGEVEQEFSGGRARYQLNLAARGGSWKVLRISQLV